MHANVCMCVCHSMYVNMCMPYLPYYVSLCVCTYRDHTIIGKHHTRKSALGLRHGVEDLVDLQDRYEENKIKISKFKIKIQN